MVELSLEERKSIELDILKDIDDICRSNGIKYFLAYGTLIGAVRHKGFIPWDDDIDIWVKIEEYEKLLEVLKTQSKYEVISNLDSEHWQNSFSKLSDPSTIIIDNGLNENECLRRGVAVDIFPIFECKMDKRWLRKLSSSQNMTQRINEYRLNRAKVSSLKDFVKMIYVNMNLVIGRDLSYWRNKTFAFELESKNTGRIGCPLSPYREKDIHPEECFSSQVYFEFEQKIFPLPVGYHTILENIYGDYMILPPLEKRYSNHAVKAFRIEGV